MTTTSRRAVMRAAAVAIALGLLSFLAIGPAISPASAHSKLVSSSPGDGSVLEAPPSEVEFTFDEELLEGTTVISINDDQGNTIATSPVHPDGKMISAPWPPGAGAGTYQAAYRIVSADGHPVAGAITFTVTGPEPVSPSTSVTEPTTAISASTSESTTTANGGPGTSAIIVVAGMVAVGVVASVVIVTRRRRAG